MLYLPTYPLTCLSTYPFVCVSVSLSIPMYLCLSVCLSVILPISLSICRTPWNTVLEKLVRRFPEFYRNRSLHCVHNSPPFVRVLTRMNPLPAPHPVSWRSILVLASHLGLLFPSSLFTSCFPTKTPYIPVPSLMHTACSALLIPLHMITRLMITIRIS
jgi:hypothetical protein